MKQNKLTRWAALILAAAMTLSLTACGGAGSDSASAGSASASQSASASAITLTDQAGRQVELDAPAETLVSCYYVTTYATMALGISDRVVGLEKKADTRPIYAMAAPELLEKEQVGTMKELNLEAVAALEPDLVVMPKKLMDYAAPWRAGYPCAGWLRLNPMRPLRRCWSCWARPAVWKTGPRP